MIMRLRKIALSTMIAAGLAVFSVEAVKGREFDLNSREDKETLLFTPKGAGKVLLTGKWEGSAKSLEVALYTPTQWLARWRGVVSKNPFELSWDLSERDLEESDRPWKIVLKARNGEAKGEAEVAGDAIEPAGEKEEKTEGKEKKSVPKSKSEKEDEVARPGKGDVPALPLDDFGLRVRRTFLETPFYKPWVDKITGGKKSARLEIRPLGLTVTPAVRKIQTRYGNLSLTVRNITLTPAQNVNLMESISGSVETRIELLMRVELPGWHLLALQVAPFAAYPGEPPRLTAMEVETRSLSRGEIIPPSSYPIAGAETILLVPVLISQPGEYLFTGRPIAREQAEILFVLGGIELYSLSH